MPGAGSWLSVRFGARRLCAASRPPSSCRAALSLPHPAPISAIARNGRAARFMNTIEEERLGGDPRAADRPDSRQSAEREVPVIVFLRLISGAYAVAPRTTRVLHYTCKLTLLIHDDVGRLGAAGTQRRQVVECAKQAAIKPPGGPPYSINTPARSGRRTASCPSR